MQMIGYLKNNCHNCHCHVKYLNKISNALNDNNILMLIE